MMAGLRTLLSAVVLAGALLLVGVLAGPPAPSLQAQSSATEVPANWDLLPSGLGPGDEFRLLIVTSTTRNAEATDIADYDAHVQSAVAANGHLDIRGHSGGFRVLGSTETVNARDHTETRATDTGVPIYYLDGEGVTDDDKIADDYAGLYDGGWDSDVPRDESGDEIGTYDAYYPPDSTPGVWTGTNSDGTTDPNRYLGFYTLGQPGHIVSYGLPRLSGSEVEVGGTLNDLTFSLYGLSEVFVVRTPSTDATLSGLRLSNGTLGPTFSSNTFDYTASVAPTATSTRVTARTTDSGAKAVIKLGGVTDTDGTVDLAVGTNTITVEVTAEDTTSKLTYTVTVTRPSDATLSGLALEDNNDAAVALTPAFDPATLSYRASVVNSVDEITIAQTENDGNANSEIQDGNGIRLTDADPDKAGFQVELSEGNNTIRVQVAAGHDTTLTYTVTVKRGIDPCPPAAISTVALVANTGETRQSGGSDDVSAQSFRTGPEPTGYTISEVRLGIVTGVGRNTNVSIREDDNGTPGTFVKHLSHLTLGNSGVFPFRGPTDLILEPATTYWITVNEGYANEGSPNPVSFQRISSNAQTREPGWSIGDDRLTSDQDSGPWVTETSSLAIEIHGTVGDTARIASLVDLELTDESGRAVALDPPFSCDQHEYEASAVAAASQVRVSVTASVADASIRYWDSVRNSAITESRFKLGHQVDLVAGMETEIRVRVTATGRNNSRTYRVIASRPPRVLVSTKSLSVTEGEGAGVSGYTLAIDGRPAANVTVTIGGHEDTPVNTNPESVTFSASDWNRPRNITVWADADSNNTNEVVRLTHTVSGLDGITIPSVIVNVDDQDAPDYHIRQITLPAGSHALLPGEKPLPEEEINDVLIYLPYVLDVESDVEGIPIEIADPIDGVYNDDIQVVAEGHIWRPSGLWGDPDEDTVWVVDPSHYGIHALKLSKLKEGLIERRVAADTSGLEQRLNYQCHFEPGRASGDGNPSLTVMWGTSSDLWIPNDSSGTIDAYSRSYSLSRGCYTRHVTSWATDLQSYETADEHFQSPFEFVAGIDVSGGPLTIRGIWASSGRVWISGPSSGSSAGDVYAFNLSPNYSVDIAAGYDGHGASYGLWSDGTTMWVATDSGWLRAYDLDTGVRSAEFDIRIRTYGMPPGDIWSDGGTIWVTNPGGSIDAYRLPERTYPHSLPTTMGDEDEDDCSDARENTNCSIAVGGAVNGVIDGEHDTDWFRVRFTSGATYEIRMRPDETAGRAAAAWINGVYNGSGAFLSNHGNVVDSQRLNEAYHTASSGANAVDGVAVTTFTAASTGDHYISLGSYGRFDRRAGDYILEIDQLAANDLINDDYLPGTTVGSVTLEEAFDLFGEIVVDGSVTGYIEDAGAYQYKPIDRQRVIQQADRDWFKVELDVGVEYRVTMRGITLHNPQIGGVYGPTVDTLAINAPVDDITAMGSLDSRLDFSVSTAGAYYIEATVQESEGPFNIGQYRLSLCEVVDDACETSETSGAPSTLRSTRAASLRASFELAPKAHDGENAFNVQIAFSDDVEITPEDLRDHALEVSGGAVTDVAKVNNRQDLWELTVQPAGTGPVVIQLLLGSETCTDPGALCTEDGQPLAVALSLQVPGPPQTLQATEAGPLTASFALAPEAHDGESGFRLRIAFSDAVETTPEDMRDHALLVSGGTVTDAARVKDRRGLWELTVQPDGPGPVSILAPLGRACTETGALCTADGRSLTAGPALVVPGPLADGPPGAPDQPAGTAVFIGGVDLEWNEVPGAESYAVQLGRGGQWIDLPGGGVEVAFYGAGAIISGLDPEATLWFQVRAANAHGVSDWSATLAMSSTSQFKLGRKARRENAPASGAPVIHGTARVGESLWGDVSGIEDGNGLNRVEFQYQWTSNDGSADTDITGATKSGYTLVADDEGKTIKVEVAFTDRGGYSETRTSVATGAVAAAPNNAATGAPTIRGTAQVGEMLTADTTGIADADGLVNATYGYQWLSDDAEIGGATDSTYTLVADDEGRTIKVRVIVTDDLGNETTLTSAATEAVAAAPQPDSPATGLPTISGTAQVGETLTANTSGIADSDGLTTSTSTYSYQWLGDDTDIAGATSSTYTLVAADEGQTIKVRVTVTDDLGNETTLTSAATEAVEAAPQPDRPATGEPTIIGTAQVGETLTANTSGIADADGLTTSTSTYSYQWLGDDTDIAGATSSTYTLVAGDEGQTIKVRVTVTDDAENKTTLTSAATEAVAAAPQPDSPATGEPTIIGTAQVGEVLTAGTTGIADADGLSGATFAYQWLADDVDISGATDATYTLVAGDEGQTIKVRVTVTDDAENKTTLTSAATEAVAAAPQPDSPATGEPTIIGTAQVGEMLTAETTGIADDDGLDSAVFAYQWLADDADISGATDATYTLVAGDEGRTIKVRVIVTDDLGNETTLTSAATEAVAAAPQPDSPATGEPTIIGTAQVGEVLTAGTTGIADADGLSGATFAYQWLADDVDISGATDASYTLVAADEGRTIKVRVIVTDDAGNETTLTSAATEAVAAAPQPDSPATGLPTIIGTPQVGQTLSVDTSGIADDDGLDSAVFAYQWLADDAEIGGATGSNYTPVDDDEGRTIKVRVTVTDDAENETTLTSGATGEVASGGPTEPPGRPLKLKGVANADGTVTLSWEAPEDESVTGYQILRKRTSRGEQTLLVHVNDTGSTGTEYTDSEVTPDVLHAYRVKAINAAGVSKRSNVVRVTPVEPEQPSGNSAATGRPSIVGTVRVGEVLTADTSGIADADGLDNVSYSYQWVVTDGGAYIDISGATGATYTLVAADRGLRILVRVSFTDDAENRETLTSAVTEAVAAAP